MCFYVHEKNVRGISLWPPKIMQDLKICITKVCMGIIIRKVAIDARISVFYMNPPLMSLIAQALPYQCTLIEQSQF